MIRYSRALALCLLLAVGLAVPAAAARGATYYVANDGSDSATGLSADEPRRTLGSLVGKAEPGDSVLLRRGDVFREGADFSSQAEGEGSGGMTFGAYGPADAPKPIISGSVAVTDWQRHEGEIRVAEVEQAIEHLFVNNELMLIARYPNEGWLRVIKGGATDGGDEAAFCPGLTDHEPNADDYWNGATMRWRRWSWVHQVRPVTDYEAETGRLVVEGTTNHTRRDPFWSGFYLEGKLEELDTPGEWYFDPEAMRVYLWPPEGADPNRALVEGAVRETGLKVHGATVEGITFRHQLGNALTITGRSKVRNCRFEGTAGAGIFAPWSVRNARVAGNVFAHNLDNAIVWNENPENGLVSVIEDNVIRETGMVPGYEVGKGWNAVGVNLYHGRGVRVRHNTIDGTGYAGIFVGHAGNTIEYNTIRRAMSTLNDGAGIYANCDRNVIRHNVISEVRGNLESSHRTPNPNADQRAFENSWSWANLGHGIWLEFLGDFRGSVVEGNTCARNGGYGLFLPNNFETVARDNVLFGNKRGQLQLSGRGSYERTGRRHDIPQNNTITGNVLCATGDEQSTLIFRPEQHYGKMLGNRFIHSRKSSPILVHGRGSEKWSTSALSISGWQRRFDWADPEPVFIGPDIMPEGAEEPVRLVTNQSREVRSVPLDGLWLDPDMNVVRGPVTLAPHTSTVLVRPARPAVVPTRRTAAAEGRLSWCHVIVEQEREWSASSNADWLVVQGEGAGTGPGTVRYKVLPNETGEAREAEITAAGRAHTVRQVGTEID
ncbi:MAG: right-handed parallel beta-helix repeat-containing protein [Planctomycetota bacterium]